MLPIDTGIPKPGPAGSTRIPEETLIELMGLPRNDSSQGWRLVVTWPSPDGYQGKAYRAAHFRSQQIRKGNVGYLTKLGKWDARARFVDEAKSQVGLWLRYLGAS